MSITENTYIRRLPIDCRRKLFEILDVNDAWRKLAAIITHPERADEPLYTVPQLSVFENGRRRGTSPSSLLVGDWETRGRNLPTITVLVDYLIRAELFRAADFLSVEILKGAPCRRPEFGIGAKSMRFEDLLSEMSISRPSEPKNNFEPAYGRSTFQNLVTDHSYAPSDCTVLRTADQESEGAAEGKVSKTGIFRPPEQGNDPGPIYGRSTFQNFSTDHSYASSNCSVVRIADQESEGAGGVGGRNYGVAPSSGDLNIENVFHYSYEQLSLCTMGFNRLLGKGAFGDVYWGQMKVKDVLEQEVAIKILAFHAKDQFLTELRVMAKYRHPNLLPLFGYSNDNPKYCCLISPYMANGSLEDRLAQKNGTKPISWQTRMTIAVGTAKGVSYLHNSGDEPLVHRDIKSANILLDEKFMAKVADFGIARIGGDWQKTTKMMTSKISGTCAYMSNEAFQGNVTVKMDTFSFGIVLLELLTGLSADDPERENRNLLSHVKEEEKSAEEWMDPKAGDWPEKVASQLLDIALRCTKGKMKKRPIIEQVVCELEEITDHL